jgi:hypothetical protein
MHVGHWEVGCGVGIEDRRADSAVVFPNSPAAAALPEAEVEKRQASFIRYVLRLSPACRARSLSSFILEASSRVTARLTSSVRP